MSRVTSVPDRDQYEESPLSGMPWLGRVGAPLMVLWTALIQVNEDEGVLQAPVLTLGLLIVSVVLLLGRRRWPVPVLAVALALYVVGVVALGSLWIGLGAVVVSLFSVVRLTDRRMAVPISVIVVALSAAQNGPAERWEVLGRMQPLAFLGCAVGFGVASRSRLAYVEAIRGRSRQAEETKEAEARRRVAEERLRIAHDLHDALAHQIAVINLNSSVASQALRARPDDAEAALAVIRHAARTVLAEMGSLLSVLRTDHSPDRFAGNAAARPVTSLRQLDQLIQEFTRAGLVVHTQIHGEPRELPEPTDIIAYYLLQEALTNALKHGLDRNACLEIDYQDTQVQITVTNNIGRTRTGAAARSGHGLIGARERACSVGGTLTSTTGPELVHRFTASLPTLTTVDTVDATS